MQKNWVKVNNYIFRETDERFSLMSCIIWEIKNDRVYIPAIHHIYKDKYSQQSIMSLVNQMFPNRDDIDFYNGILLLSSFIGECLDIYDENNEQICFYLDESNKESIPDKLLSIATDLKL